MATSPATTHRVNDNQIVSFANAQTDPSPETMKQPTAKAPSPSTRRPQCLDARPLSHQPPRYQPIVDEQYQQIQGEYRDMHSEAEDPIEYLDVELAINAIEPKYVINQGGDAVCQARMSLLELKEEDSEYQKLVKVQRDLFRQTKSWKCERGVQKENAGDGKVADGDAMEMD